TSRTQWASSAKCDASANPKRASSPHAKPTTRVSPSTHHPPRSTAGPSCTNSWRARTAANPMQADTCTCGPGKPGFRRTRKKSTHHGTRGGTPTSARRSSACRGTAGFYSPDSWARRCARAMPPSKRSERSRRRGKDGESPRMYWLQFRMARSCVGRRTQQHII
ncbi:hypothetical protein LTR40_001017, partial [Exophiala xenobiotica]